jgi:hypothetical protein
LIARNEMEVKVTGRRLRQSNSNDRDKPTISDFVVVALVLLRVFESLSAVVVAVGYDIEKGLYGQHGWINVGGPYGQS